MIDRRGTLSPGGWGVGGRGWRGGVGGSVGHAGAPWSSGRYVGQTFTLEAKSWDHRAHCFTIRDGHGSLSEYVCMCVFVSKGWGRRGWSRP